MADYATTHRAPQGGREQRVETLDRGGSAARLELLVHEPDEVLGPHVDDAHVAEEGVEVLGARAVGVERVRPGVRVAGLALDEPLDGLADRLLRLDVEPCELALGRGAGVPGLRVDDPAVDLPADQPLAAAGVPGLPGVAAAFAQGGHQ